jgi:hypothetical protein
VPSQVAEPLVGTGQATQLVPQVAGLVLSEHRPPQSCVPVGHIPLQAIAIGMHAP